MSEDTKNKISIAKRGENNIFFGKKGSEHPAYGNYTKHDESTSEYFGVSMYTQKYKNRIYTYWRVTIFLNGKFKHIGQRKTELEAALLYNDYIIENKLQHPLNNI